MAHRPVSDRSGFLGCTGTMSGVASEVNSDASREGSGWTQAYSSRYAASRSATEDARIAVGGGAHRVAFGEFPPSLRAVGGEPRREPAKLRHNSSVLARHQGERSSDGKSGVDQSLQGYRDPRNSATCLWIGIRQSSAFGPETSNSLLCPGRG